MPSPAAPRSGYAPGSQLRPFFTGAAARLSPDGARLATTCGEEAHVLDARDGRVLATLGGDSEPLTALAWRCESGSRRGAHARARAHALFSRDGKTVYTASRSMQCRRWELAAAAAAAADGPPPPTPLTGHVARAWKAHPLPVNDMQLDATGGLLVRRRLPAGACTRRLTHVRARARRRRRAVPTGACACGTSGGATAHTR